MKVTYYGHSCFSVEIAGNHLLFDPFIRPNELAAHIDVSALRPDFIFISHAHWDHLADVVEIASNSKASIICNYEIGDWLMGQGIAKVNQMNTGGKKAFDWGRAKLTNAIHSSSLPDKSYGGTAAGFVIESEEGNFYYSGDTALTMDMELTGRHHELDFAVLPIGDNFTMDVDDAIACAKMIHCEHVIGVHYDTFPVIQINKNEAAAKFHAAGKELILIPIGESKEMTVSARNPVY